MDERSEKFFLFKKVTFFIYNYFYLYISLFIYLFIIIFCYYKPQALSAVWSASEALIFPSGLAPRLTISNVNQYQKLKRNKKL